MHARSPLLQLRGLAPHTLAPIDLAIDHGECVAVQGPSGSGKSLLLRAVADLDPAMGEVLLEANPRSAMSGPAWRRRVTYLAADSGWWADRVSEHFPHWEALAEETAALGLPPDCRDWRIERLSTGERQRLALLRALANHPQMLLLDEPTSGLDAEAVGATETLIRNRQSTGTGVLWVTHDREQADRVASRRLTVMGGKVKIR